MPDIVRRFGLTRGQDRLGQALPQRSSGEPVKLDRAGDTIQDRLDLKATLDAILSSTRQLVPYDIAEITLWDGDRQCCVTRGWGGDEAYAWEAGGTYCLDEGYTGWVARHQRSLFIPDVQARHDVRPKLDTPEYPCLLYTSPSPRDATLSRMPSSA